MFLWLLGKCCWERNMEKLFHITCSHWLAQERVLFFPRDQFSDIPGGFVAFEKNFETLIYCQRWLFGTGKTFTLSCSSILRYSVFLWLWGRLFVACGRHMDTLFNIPSGKWLLQGRLLIFHSVWFWELVMALGKNLSCWGRLYMHKLFHIPLGEYLVSKSWYPAGNVPAFGRWKLFPLKFSRETFPG